MKYLLYILGLIISTSCFSQNNYEITISNKDSSYVGYTIQVAESEVRSIIEFLGLNTDFDIVSNPKHSNIAKASQRHGRRRLVYNPHSMDDIRLAAGTNWATIFVMAHELAHHYNNDVNSLQQGTHYRNREKRADHFAATTLARMGASLEQTLSIFKYFENKLFVNPYDINHLNTHPSTARRRQICTNAWKQAQPKSNDDEK